MMDRKGSIYNSVADFFNVIDISNPIRIIVKPNTMLNEVMSMFMETEENDWFCLVKSEKRLYGYLAFDDDAFINNQLFNTAEKEATTITPDIIVASTMSIVKLIPLFKDRYYFFVLSHNQITHIVSFRDLDKLPVKLCIFSLFIELESKLLSLIRTMGKTENLVSCLPESRIIKVKNLYKLKYNKSPEPNSSNLLLCTTFSDKKMILSSKPEFVERMGFSSKNKMKNFLELIEKVRNSIAHSDSILMILKTPEEFDDFLVRLIDLIDKLSDS